MLHPLAPIGRHCPWTVLRIPDSLLTHLYLGSPDTLQKLDLWKSRIEAATRSADEYRIGVDVRGTFTDLVLLTVDGSAYPKKVLFSQPNFNLAIRQGTKQPLEEHELKGSQIKEYAHGATDAIITRTLVLLRA